MPPALDDHESRLRLLERSATSLEWEMAARKAEMARWLPVLERLLRESDEGSRDRTRHAVYVSRWGAILGAAWLGLTPLLTALIVYLVTK